MRSARRTPGPPLHTTRKGRLAPYDAAAERRAAHNLQLDLAEGSLAIAAASMSLTNHMYHEVLRDQEMPEANPLNAVEVEA